MLTRTILLVAGIAHSACASILPLSWRAKVWPIGPVFTLENKLQAAALRTTQVVDADVQQEMRGHQARRQALWSVAVQHRGGRAPRSQRCEIRGQGIGPGGAGPKPPSTTPNSVIPVVMLPTCSSAASGWSGDGPASRRSTRTASSTSLQAAATERGDGRREAGIFGCGEKCCSRAGARPAAWPSGRPGKVRGARRPRLVAYGMRGPRARRIGILRPWRRRRPGPAFKAASAADGAKIDAVVGACAANQSRLMSIRSSCNVRSKPAIW